MAKRWHRQALCNVRMVAKVMGMVNNVMGCLVLTKKCRKLNTCMIGKHRDSKDNKVSGVFSFGEKMPKTKHLHGHSSRSTEHAAGMQRKTGTRCGNAAEG